MSSPPEGRSQAPAARGPRSGPLRGLKVIELGSIGPGPFCCMVLADLGAEVLRIERPSGVPSINPKVSPGEDLLNRGRRTVQVDLKDPRGAALVLSLVEAGDVLVEGYRPGVAERLGVGPDPCSRRNPGLVYTRITGWGHGGPYSSQVGHDLNYIAIAGTLGLIGRAGEPPMPPLSLVGDFGGGLVAVAGTLAALFERERSGAGQVVDAAMVDSAALLTTAFFGYVQAGGWSGEHGTNLVDTGAPFYEVYEAQDGRYVAVAALEADFYTDLLKVLGLDPAALPDQHDQARWPDLKRRFAEIFRTRTRDQWCAAAVGTDACLSPVLSLDELEDEPHLRERGTIVRHEGRLQPAPAPRFERTAAALWRGPAPPGADGPAALAGWGVAADHLDSLTEAGVVTAPPDPEHAP